MTIPSRQQAYGQAVGTATIPTFVFRDRDPSSSDTTPNYQLYTSWVNTVTKAIWYLEAFVTVSGVVTSQWRSVGPVVVKTIDPTPSDINYPIGQTWVNTQNGNYFALVNVFSGTATWALLAANGGNVTFLEGNTGGPVGPNAGLINVVGAGLISVSGNPGTSTLTITSSGSFGAQIVTSATNPNVLQPNNIYIAKGGSPVVFQLPPASNLGDIYKILGYGNLWSLTQNAGQTVYIGNNQTTAGFGGSITATMIHDSIELVCVTPNLEWQILPIVGNPTIV